MLASMADRGRENLAARNPSASRPRSSDALRRCRRPLAIGQSIDPRGTTHWVCCLVTVET